jgi:hypothetical protein
VTARKQEQQIRKTIAIDECLCVIKKPFPPQRHHAAFERACYRARYIQGGGGKVLSGENKATPGISFL